jgi:hypothetical protein
MLKRAALLAAFAAPVPAVAQTVVDGSGHAIGEAGIAQVVAILKDSLFDPSSTKLRALRSTSHGYCGQLNTTSRSGPDRAFHRFAIDLDTHALFIEGAPQEVESNRSNLAGIRRVCGGV